MRFTALFRRLSIVACLFALSACSSPVEDSAESAQVAQELAIFNVWARPTLTLKQPGGVYLEIANNTDTDDTLVAVSSPRASRGEMHDNLHQDGVVRMVKLEQVVIGAGTSVHFKPGGMHIMLMGLDSQLVGGQDVPMTFTFEHAGDVDVVAVVSSDMMGMEGAHGH